MGDELRCYLLIDASAPRTTAQWNSLIGAVKDKPMVLAVRQAVHGTGPQNRVNLNRPSITYRYMLGDFEIDKDDKSDLLTVLNEQCALRGIVETGARAKFEALIQAELREAAVDLGYTPAQAASLFVTVVGLGERVISIDECRTWFLAGKEEWE